MYKADNVANTCNGLVAGGKTSFYTDNNKCSTGTTTNPVAPVAPVVLTPVVVTPAPTPTPSDGTVQPGAGTSYSWVSGTGNAAL